MAECENTSCSCPQVELENTPIPVPTQADYVSSIEQDNADLRKKLTDEEHEENRLRYMVTGYIALIAMTKDADLIAKAAQIAIDADKL